MQQLFGGVVDRLRAGRSGMGRGSQQGPQALTALDVGTEFAKALVVALEEREGVLTGVVRGVGRQRQGLTPHAVGHGQRYRRGGRQLPPGAGRGASRWPA